MQKSREKRGRPPRGGIVALARKAKNAKEWGWLLLLGPAVLYFLSLPLYLQGGDTSELVAAAYKRLVPHPPGYPLWIWLQNIWLHLLPWYTPFWRASALGALFALSVLAILGLVLRKKPFALLLCLPVLAFSTPFLEAALLPDVFSFHALLVALVGALFLFADPRSKLRCFGIPFLLVLGLAHHLTIVTLFPLALTELWTQRKNARTRKWMLLGAASGASATLGLYGSLLFLHPESVFSWGLLQDTFSLWRHFLREDYGTFRLVAQGGGIGAAPLLFFWSTSFREILVLLLFSLWVLAKNPSLARDLALRVWLGCTVLSLLLFFAMNANLSEPGKEVLLRFHTMPVVQLVFFCAYVLSRVKIGGNERWTGLAVTSPVALLLLVHAIQLLPLHKDSVIEDHARNLLAQASRHRPALVLADNDSVHFTLRYLQAVEGEGQGVGVAATNLLLHPWYFHKVKEILPDLQLQNAERAWASRTMDFEQDLVFPNLSRVNLVVLKGFRNATGMKVTYLGLGRFLSQGSGTAFAVDPAVEVQLRSTVEFPQHTPQAFTKRLLFSQYSHYFLARGMASHSAGRAQEAIMEWNLALEKVPYALPALQNICQLSPAGDPRCEEKVLATMRAQSSGLF